MKNNLLDRMANEDGGGLRMF